MAVPISPVLPVSPAIGATPAPAGTRPPSEGSFGDLLGSLLQQVSQTQGQVQTVQQQVAAGQTQDLARVVMVSEQATLTLELVTQVRNKMLEAYQEIMRMPM